MNLQKKLEEKNDNGNGEKGIKLSLSLIQIRN